MSWTSYVPRQPMSAEAEVHSATHDVFGALLRMMQQQPRIHVQDVEFRYMHRALPENEIAEIVPIVSVVLDHRRYDVWWHSNGEHVARMHAVVENKSQTNFVLHLFARYPGSTAQAIPRFMCDVVNAIRRSGTHRYWLQRHGPNVLPQLPGLAHGC